VPHLLRLGKIKLIYCVEISSYRLFEVGPVVLEHYSVPKDKVVLALGSFYKLKLPDNSLDFAFMSAAFHHADDPDALLAEIRRVLKPGGVVLITVEHITEVTPQAYMKHFLRFFASRTVPPKIQYKLFRNTFRAEKLFPKPNELFPPDPVLGDHYYTRWQYREMFSRHGFKMDRIRDGSQAFILFR
jgi:ubiquinone/menaquinone biosynthesis C-methylase UbiE